MTSDDELKQALQEEYAKGHFDHAKPTNITAFKEHTVPIPHKVF